MLVLALGQTLEWTMTLQSIEPAWLSERGGPSLSSVTAGWTRAASWAELRSWLGEGRRRRSGRSGGRTRVRLLPQGRISLWPVSKSGSGCTELHGVLAESQGKPSHW